MSTPSPRNHEQGPHPTLWACAASAGRPNPEPPDSLRNDFQCDRDRIIHAKAFRRLMHKTQVFIAPDGDHFRTRLTHTLEMMQISRTISRSLGLNEDLAEAIALGHDLGHTPFRSHRRSRTLPCTRRPRKDLPPQRALPPRRRQAGEGRRRPKPHI